MLYNEPVELILQQVQLQAIVKINDLKDLLNVSVDTVRRDLKTMEQSGLINVYVAVLVYLIHCRLYPILPVGKFSI